MWPTLPRFKKQKKLGYFSRQMFEHYLANSLLDRDKTPIVLVYSTPSGEEILVTLVEDLGNNPHDIYRWTDIVLVDEVVEFLREAKGLDFQLRRKPKLKLV